MDMYFGDSWVNPSPGEAAANWPPEKKTLEGYFFSSLYHLVIACTARVLPHVHCLHSKAWPDWGCQFCPWSLLAQRGMVRLSMYTPNKVCSGFFYFIFGCVIEVHVFGLFRVLLRLLCLAPQFLSFWSCPKQNWSSWQNWIFFLLWRTYLDFLLSKKSFIDTFWPVVSPSLAFPTRQCTSHFHTNKKKQRRHWEERKSQNPRHKCVSLAIQECLRFLSFTKSQMDLSNWLHYLSGPAWSQNYLSANNHSTVEISPPQN